MMKSLPSAFLLTLACPAVMASAAENTFSSGRFQKLCKSTLAYEKVACSSYVTGLRHFQDISDRKLFCLPTEVVTDQLVKVAMKYCDDHPEELHIPFAYVAIRSFSLAFPCEAGSSFEYEKGATTAP